MTTQSLYKSPAGEQAVMELYDNALAHWPVPYETLTLATRHGDTFAIACGAESAPPLILLHGAGTNSAIWGADVAAYAQHYRVYAVDLLGEAGKSSPNRPAWDSPAYAEWLADVFDALHIDKAVLVGISQGGWTALKFTAANPGRVEKLVLICPGGIVPDKVSFIIRAMGLSLLGDRGVRGMIHMLYAKHPIPAGVEDIFTIMMGNFKGRMGVLPIFADDELRRLTMPTLLLGGTDDALRDMDKIAARLQTLLPQLDVTIIPGAGHVVMNTTDRILTFLKAHEAILEPISP
jgi:pimeloyl-ACP methyl ester carboxylesterase